MGMLKTAHFIFMALRITIPTFMHLKQANMQRPFLFGLQNATTGMIMVVAYQHQRRSIVQEQRDVM